MVSTIEISTHFSESTTASPLAIYWYNLQSSIQKHSFRNIEKRKNYVAKRQQLDSIASAVDESAMMDDIWIVSDNARSHESKNFLLQFPLYTAHYSKHYLPNHCSLSTPAYDSMSTTDQNVSTDCDSHSNNQLKESLKAATANNSAPFAADQWDRTKDSVVGFGNAKKNRWGNHPPATPPSLSSTGPAPLFVTQFRVDPIQPIVTMAPPFLDDRSSAGGSAGSCAPSDGSALPLVMPQRRISNASSSTGCSLANSIDFQALREMNDDTDGCSDTLLVLPQRRRSVNTDYTIPKDPKQPLQRPHSLIDEAEPKRSASENSSSSFFDSVSLPPSSHSLDKVIVLPQRRVSKPTEVIAMNEEDNLRTGVSRVETSFRKTSTDTAMQIPRRRVSNIHQTVNDACDTLAASDSLYVLTEAQNVDKETGEMKTSNILPKPLKARSKRFSISRQHSMDSIPEIMNGLEEEEDNVSCLPQRLSTTSLVITETGKFGNLTDSLHLLHLNGSGNHAAPYSAQLVAGKDSFFSESPSSALGCSSTADKTNASGVNPVFDGGFAKERRDSGSLNPSTFPPRIIGAARTRVSETSSIQSLDWLEDWMVDQIREEDENFQGDGGDYEKEVKNLGHGMLCGADDKSGASDTIADESTCIVRQPPTRTDSRELALDRRYERRHAIVAQALAASHKSDSRLSGKVQATPSVAGSGNSVSSSTPSIPPLIETISYRDGRRRSSGYISKYIRALQVVNMSTIVVPSTTDYWDLPSQNKDASEEGE